MKAVFSGFQLLVLVALVFTDAGAWDDNFWGSSDESDSKTSTSQGNKPEPKFFFKKPWYDKKPKNDPSTPCLEVTITGSKGGPRSFGGFAGTGTLVTYGTLENDCRNVTLQFDMGRGSTLRLSEVGIETPDLDAIFFTNVNTENIDDLALFMYDRWTFSPEAIDIFCGEDPIDDFTSCRSVLDSVGSGYIDSGFVPQRALNDPVRFSSEGPVVRVNPTFVPSTEEPLPIYTFEDLTVSSIRTQHIGGSLAYRVDSPAGSVVIGGRATNDETDVSLRTTSTSGNVEALAQGADILVQSAIHPVNDPGFVSNTTVQGFFRLSIAPDIGSMAQRAGVGLLIPTALVPVVGQPNAFTDGLSRSDWAESIRDGGYTGKLIVADDLTKMRLT